MIVAEYYIVRCVERANGDRDVRVLATADTPNAALNWLDVFKILHPNQTFIICTLNGVEIAKSRPSKHGMIGGLYHSDN